MATNVLAQVVTLARRNAYTYQPETGDGDQAPTSAAAAAESPYYIDYSHLVLSFLFLRGSLVLLLRTLLDDLHLSVISSAMHLLICLLEPTPLSYSGPQYNPLSPTAPTSASFSLLHGSLSSASLSINSPHASSSSSFSPLSPHPFDLKMGHSLLGTRPRAPDVASVASHTLQQCFDDEDVDVSLAIVRAVAAGMPPPPPPSTASGTSSSSAATTRTTKDSAAPMYVSPFASIEDGQAAVDRAKEAAATRAKRRHARSAANGGEDDEDLSLEQLSTFDFVAALMTTSLLPRLRYILAAQQERCERLVMALLSIDKPESSSTRSTTSAAAGDASSLFPPAAVSASADVGTADLTRMARDMADQIHSCLSLQVAVLNCLLLVAQHSPRAATLVYFTPHLLPLLKRIVSPNSPSVYSMALSDVVDASDSSSSSSRSSSSSVTASMFVALELSFSRRDVTTAQLLTVFAQTDRALAYELAAQGVPLCLKRHLLGLTHGTSLRDLFFAVRREQHRGMSSTAFTNLPFSFSPSPSSLSPVDIHRASALARVEVAAAALRLWRVCVGLDVDTDSFVTMFPALVAVISLPLTSPTNPPAPHSPSPSSSLQSPTSAQVGPVSVSVSEAISSTLALRLAQLHRAAYNVIEAALSTSTITFLLTAPSFAGKGKTGASSSSTTASVSSESSSVSMSHAAQVAFDSSRYVHTWLSSLASSSRSPMASPTTTPSQPPLPSQWSDADSLMLAGLLHTFATLVTLHPLHPQFGIPNAPKTSASASASTSTSPDAAATASTSANGSEEDEKLRATSSATISNLLSKAESLVQFLLSSNIASCVPVLCKLRAIAFPSRPKATTDGANEGGGNDGNDDNGQQLGADDDLMGHRHFPFPNLPTSTHTTKISSSTSSSASSSSTAVDLDLTLALVRLMRAVFALRASAHLKHAGAASAGSRPGSSSASLVDWSKVLTAAIYYTFNHTTASGPIHAATSSSSAPSLSAVVGTGDLTREAVLVLYEASNTLLEIHSTTPDPSAPACGAALSFPKQCCLLALGTIYRAAPALLSFGLTLPAYNALSKHLLAPRPYVGLLTSRRTATAETTADSAAEVYYRQLSAARQSILPLLALSAAVDILPTSPSLALFEELIPDEDAATGSAQGQGSAAESVSTTGASVAAVAAGLLDDVARDTIAASCSVAITESAGLSSSSPPAPVLVPLNTFFVVPSLSPLAGQPGHDGWVWSPLVVVRSIVTHRSVQFLARQAARAKEEMEMGLLHGQFKASAAQKQRVKELRAEDAKDEAAEEAGLNQQARALSLGLEGLVILVRVAAAAHGVDLGLLGLTSSSSTSTSSDSSSQGVPVPSFVRSLAVHAFRAAMEVFAMGPAFYNSPALRPVLASLLLDLALAVPDTTGSLDAPALHALWRQASAGFGDESATGGAGTRGSISLPASNPMSSGQTARDAVAAPGSSRQPFQVIASLQGQFYSHFSSLIDSFVAESTGDVLFSALLSRFLRCDLAFDFRRRLWNQIAQVMPRALCVPDADLVAKEPRDALVSPVGALPFTPRQKKLFPLMRVSPGGAVSLSVLQSPAEARAELIAVYTRTLGGRTVFGQPLTRDTNALLYDLAVAHCSRNALTSTGNSKENEEGDVHEAAKLVAALAGTVPPSTLFDLCWPRPDLVLGARSVERTKYVVRVLEAAVDLCSDAQERDAIEAAKTQAPSPR